MEDGKRRQVQGSDQMPKYSYHDNSACRKDLGIAVECKLNMRPAKRRKFNFLTASHKI